MDLGEAITDTAIRETREETGIVCEVTGLVGIYTSPRHVIRYTSNHEVRQEFSVVFTARPVGGELCPSSETPEPQWVSPDEVLNLPMHPSMRQRIGHYLDGRPSWPLQPGREVQARARKLTHAPPGRLRGRRRSGPRRAIWPRRVSWWTPLGSSCSRMFSSHRLRHDRAGRQAQLPARGQAAS
jgi:ADP-ribose pyrophosphatase YjhB (NUDIX family)